MAIELVQDMDIIIALHGLSKGGATSRNHRCVWATSSAYDANFPEVKVDGVEQCMERVGAWVKGTHPWESTPETAHSGHCAGGPVHVVLECNYY